MSIELTTGPFDSESRLHEAIASFEKARDSGRNPNTEEWLARYGYLAGPLGEFFANQQRVCRLAAALLPPQGQDKLPMIQDYQILEKLPASGQGVVYKARQLSANRLVALKVIRSDRLAGQSTKRRQQTLDRFRTEAQAAAQLEHPNIVGVHEIGEVDDAPFYSMQYVAGSNLAEGLAQGPLAPAKAAVYIEQIAQAIHVAHQHGILHRDLKPANILIDTASDRPLVTDFGLAKLMQSGSDATGTGDIIGTAPYMSPEQAQDSSRVTIASDVYSLGATLYALLTGRPPFQGDNPVTVLKKVIEEEPPAPRKIKPAIPRDLETICLKCLEKQPAQRYASAEELAADLRRWRSGDPVHADRGRASRLFGALMRETRYTEVMTLWSGIWMGTAVAYFLNCLAKSLFLWYGVTDHGPFFAVLFGTCLCEVGLLWFGRFRRGPSLTQVERQMLQIWFLVWLSFFFTSWQYHRVGAPIAGLPPILILQLAVAIGAIAAILGGSFYVMTAACVGTAVLESLWPEAGPLISAVFCAPALFWVGWKYSRRRSARPNSESRSAGDK